MQAARANIQGYPGECMVMYTTTIESPIKVSFEKRVINDSLNSLTLEDLKELIILVCVINDSLSSHLMTPLTNF